MSDSGSALIVSQGMCYALLAFDVGLLVDLEEAARGIAAEPGLGRLARVPGPGVRPEPLLLVQPAPPIPVGAWKTAEEVELRLYDFGALSATYAVPIAGPLAGLSDLTEALHANPLLLADAKVRAERLLHAVRKAVKRPGLSDHVEDYVILQAEACSTGGEAAGPDFADGEIARVLRRERRPLSEQEVQEATACRLSVGLDDAAILDWDAAFLFGRDQADVRAVLDLANVELLEMRILDRRLDEALGEASRALSRRMPGRVRLPGTFEADLARIARLQVDGALLFERVTNSLKLLDDQRLARLYRLASRRFHLRDWDASILRKLQTLDSIYEKMADRASARRLEALEWIIIVLIAASILLSVFLH